jgi:hypothetical protein
MEDETDMTSEMKEEREINFRNECWERDVEQGIETYDLEN